MYSSFVILFNIEPPHLFDGENDLLFSILYNLINVILFIVTGLLVGLHEIKDILRDYITDKKRTQIYIRIASAFVWIIIITLILLIIVGLFY